MCSTTSGGSLLQTLGSIVVVEVKVVMSFISSEFPNECGVCCNKEKKELTKTKTKASGTTIFVFLILIGILVSMVFVIRVYIKF